MAQSRQYVDKAVADANRGRTAVVRAAGGCAWLKVYRAFGLLALEKSELGCAALAKEHDVATDTEVDEEIELLECIEHSDGRALLRMDHSVLMVVADSACIVQADDEGGEVFQVQFEAKGERMTWLCGQELQVEFRSDVTIAHLGRKLHVVLQTEEHTVTVLYDEGPVKQVTLTEDGRAGVRLREEGGEGQGVKLEEAKARKAEVTAARDEAKALMPAVKEAIAAAEAMGTRAKLAYDAASEKDKAFREARAKVASKDDEDKVVDVALEDGSLAKVSKKRVEMVQLSEKFDSAQLQLAEDGGWTWGCNGGISSTRADGTALVKLTEDVSTKVNAELKIKIARVQLMTSGDRIVALEDGSRFQLMKDGALSFVRDPTMLGFSEGFCTFAGNGKRSKLEDEGDLIHEEDSGLSWALRGDELVVLSAGHSFPDSDAVPAAKAKAKAKAKSKAPEEKKEKQQFGKPGLVEDAATEEPLASAAVYAKALSTSESGFSAECVTDGDGHFDLERSEDVVIRAEKAGYAPDLLRVNSKSLAFCLRLHPLTTSETFRSASGIVLKHGGCILIVKPGTVMTSDESPHSGMARLDLSLPSSGDELSLYVGIADDEKEKDAALSSQVRMTLESTATLRDGAPLPVAWTLNVDAARMHLPRKEKRSLVFRSVFKLPGVYRDLETSAAIRVDVETAVIPLLQREYQGSDKAKLDEPRLYVAYTACELMVNGIVDVAGDEVPEVTPLLREEAKKGPLKSALDKCKVTEVKLETTYETVVPWVSSGIFVDGIEVPAVDEDILMRAHSEVNLIRELKQVAAQLSRASGLQKEADAASELKSVPGPLKDLASACLSLFADGKKTAEQIGGWNYFRKDLKSGLLGRCTQLNPYRVSEKILKRTQQLAKFDDAKLQANYPAAALLGVWVREFLKCAAALHELGVSVKDKKMGNPIEHSFLNVASPVPALTALRAPPVNGSRVVEFVAPTTGWWTVDFDSWRAVGGGAAAAKALV